MAHSHDHQAPSDGGAALRKTIWKTFWIMLILTAFEFLIAFTMKHGALKINIFILMTIVKAYYIVAEFMHLRHEAKALIWSVLIPCTLLLWFVVALMVEGAYFFDMLQIFKFL